MQVFQNEEKEVGWNILGCGDLGGKEGNDVRKVPVP
jgi:hypothetical protein